MLVEFLRNLAPFIGVGVLLDKVLIGEKESEKLRKYLEGVPQRASYSGRYFELLDVAHAAVFGRFLSGSLFSRSFIISAFLISTLSFTTVFSIQVYFRPAAMSEISWSGIQVVIFLSFICFNIIFDYFTIVQTKIFFDAALSMRSVFRSIILVISDLIVTMNSFILAYSFFLGVLIYLFTYSGNEVQIRMSNEQLRDLVGEGFRSASGPVELSQLGFGELSDRISHWGRIDAVAESAEGAELVDLVNYVYSDFQPSQSDALLMFTATTSTRVEIQRWSYLEHRAQSVGDFDDLDNNERLALWVEIGAGEIDFEMIQQVYTQTFYRTDEMEDGFPGSLGNIEFIEVSSFVGNTLARDLRARDFVYCYTNNGILILRLMEGLEFDFSQCDRVAYIQFNWPMANESRLAVLGRSLHGLVMPYNTLLITSVLPTAFLYLSIILISIASFSVKYFLGRLSVAREYFLRAPIAIVAVVIGLIVTILG